ncbi:hypothetical protein HU200_053581 [Digitaria exilis]|uniref:Uncharacterized protein n=1 Tax=Digitaria exilis TaxID=1010633 RepID=A0A835E6B6_9POAL|nr:hypothetical protein HU200_053581 [Digitaria exilis]
MVASWEIWTHPNEIILDGFPLSLRRWKQIFKDEFSLILIVPENGVRGLVM